MTTSEEFNTFYKTFSSTALLAIVENSEDYQPVALVAAKNELSKRDVTNIEINEAKKTLFEKELLNLEKKERLNSILNNIKTTGQTIVESINPFQNSKPSNEKSTRILAMVFALNFLYILIKNFRRIQVTIQDFLRFPLASASYLLPINLIGVGAFLLWKKKLLGWILIVVYLTFSSLFIMLSLVYSFAWKPSGVAAIDAIFPKPDILNYFLQLAFLLAMLYFLCKKSIRTDFAASNGLTIKTIGITTFSVLLCLYIVSS